MLYQIQSQFADYSAQDIHSAMFIVLLTIVAFVMLLGAFSGGKAE